MRIPNGIFLIGIMFNFSCGRSYIVPSGAMENTIKPNETVYVSAAREYQINDMAVYDIFWTSYSGPNGSVKKWMQRLHRIVAMSGQKLEVKNGEVWLNDQLTPLPDSAKLLYNVSCKTIPPYLPIGEYDQPRQVNDSLYFILPLTKTMAKEIAREGKNEVTINSWTGEDERMDFGPFIIPQPGDIIEVDSSNFYLYHNIPGIRMGKNRIDEALYFMMGDNRYFSEDSRFTGFISQSKLRGIVKL